MNQKKTGDFLKQLRKEKGLTQEQLAERFFVSDRTVSRWETGSNMPDLSVLVDLADYYQVDIREIIDGERKSETMNDETKNTLKKVAEYTAEENKKLRYRMADMMIGAGILLVFCSILLRTDGFHGQLPLNAYHNMISFTMGAAIATLAVNVLYLFGVFDRIQEKKFLRKKNRDKE